MPVEYLNPSDAARRLGVSAKALRLYEQRGLVTPVRTAAGWRAYGPAEMARAAEVAALRRLGLSLAQAARVLNGEAKALEPALAAHQQVLEAQMRGLAGQAARVREIRAGLAEGRTPSAAALADLSRSGPAAAFDLPWPWGGERFELPSLAPLTFLVGPLGSGKTRLALAIAEALPGAAFLGLDRQAPETLSADMESALAWLKEEGASRTPALVALIAGLEAEGGAAVVVDLVEQGLDAPSQEALAAWLRRRGPAARPLVLMTRSTAILDLEAVGANEAILFCPANHAPPQWVAPYPGAEGFEALASCLASPQVRARTEGVIAVRPHAAPVTS